MFLSQERNVVVLTQELCLVSLEAPGKEEEGWKCPLTAFPSGKDVQYRQETTQCCIYMVPLHYMPVDLHVLLHYTCCATSGRVYPS